MITTLRIDYQKYNPIYLTIRLKISKIYLVLYRSPIISKAWGNYGRKLNGFKLMLKIMIYG